MADQDLSHTAEIIKAAIPYVDSSLSGMAELFAKLLDLMGSLKSGKSGKLSANGLRGIKIDVEGLLKGIRPICSIKEREFVDKILGFLNMKKMFEMYNNMMSTMQTMQEFGGFNFGDSSSTNDAENVTGNFSSSNFDSIFKAFSSSFGSNDTSAPSDPEYTSETAENTAQFSTKEAVESETPNETSSNTGNNEGMMNNKMMDMLKAMVPPEQMSTFENLSMLFNTMSYDNNKSDDNKELNDG